MEKDIKLVVKEKYGLIAKQSKTQKCGIQTGGNREIAGHILLPF